MSLHKILKEESSGVSLEENKDVCGSKLNPNGDKGSSHI